MMPKGNSILAFEFALGSDLNTANDHSVTQDWVLDLTEEEICCSWSWGMARMPTEASEPPAATLPPHLLPSSLAHLPPPTHLPYSRMIFPSTSPSMVFLCLEKKGKNRIGFPAAFRKKPQSLSLMRRGGRRPSSLFPRLLSPTALCASCTQPRIVLYLPILQTTVPECLLFLGSNHFPPLSDPTTSPGSLSYPFRSAAHRPQAARGIL